MSSPFRPRSNSLPPISSLHSSSPPGPPSSSPPTSPLSSGRAGSPFFCSSSRFGSSPNTMHSDLHASPGNMKKTLETAPRLADETDSIFFDLSSPPNPERTARHQFIHERMKRKQHPYPMYPAPIEVRYAACVMGREHTPYVSLEELRKV
jgi:hypothetical protein